MQNVAMLSLEPGSWVVGIRPVICGAGIGGGSTGGGYCPYRLFGSTTLTTGAAGG